MIRVLCVDDDPAALYISKAFLEESGELSVDTVTSADEAVGRIAASHYDVIVSDYYMPRTNGLELLRLIRSKGWTIPFILFSGLEREAVIAEACSSGASFYVQKGADVTAQYLELEHTIQQVAARAAAELELRTRKLQAGLAVDLAGVSRWEYDPLADVFTFDDMFYRLYRTDAEREGGHKMRPDRYFHEFVHPDDVERVLAFVDRGWESLGPNDHLDIEHRGLRRDGTVVRVAVRMARMMDNDGRLLKVYGITRVKEP